MKLNLLYDEKFFNFELTMWCCKACSTMTNSVKLHHTPDILKQQRHSKSKHTRPLTLSSTKHASSGKWIVMKLLFIYCSFLFRCSHATVWTTLQDMNGCRQLVQNFWGLWFGSTQHTTCQSFYESCVLGLSSLLETLVDF